MYKSNCFFIIFIKEKCIENIKFCCFCDLALKTPTKVTMIFFIMESLLLCKAKPKYRDIKFLKFDTYLNLPFFVKNVSFCLCVFTRGAYQIETQPSKRIWLCHPA